MGAMTRILLIDDDKDLTDFLSGYLTEEGFEVHCVHDGRDSGEKAVMRQYDIVVLDIMTPDVNGLEILQRIRKFSDVPILMIGAGRNNINRIIGLNLGADDYVPKPCSPDELVARVRAILRRSIRPSMQDAGVEVLQSERLKLFPASRTAEWQGRPLDLTGTEFNLLEVLVRSAGRLVSRQDISKRAFGRSLTSFDRRVDVHISSIRQKLATASDGRSWIKNVRGQGYQLIRENG